MVVARCQAPIRGSHAIIDLNRVLSLSEDERAAVHCFTLGAAGRPGGVEPYEVLRDTLRRLERRRPLADLCERIRFYEHDLELLERRAVRVAFQSAMRE